jgi:hypothetical protein
MQVRVKAAPGFLEANKLGELKIFDTIFESDGTPVPIDRELNFIPTSC